MATPDPPRRGARRRPVQHRRPQPRTYGSARWAWPLALAALGVIAFAWRMAYLHRLSLTPLGGSLTEDALVYWTWAETILRHGPIGSHPFFLGPLYPYVLSVLRLFGASIAGVLAIQSLWGAGGVVLLADAARRLTNPAFGALTGLLMAGYEMSVFFDGLILMESLLFFLEALLLWWIVRRDWTRAPARAFAVAGVIVGVLAEGRATAVLLFVVAAIVLIPWRRAGRAALRPAVALLAGFALVTVPVAVRNVAVSGEWIPFTYNLGVNLYIGNNPEATGGFGLFGETHRVRGKSVAGSEADTELDGREYLRKAEGVSLSPAGSSAWWARKALAYAAAHPARVARLSLRKLGMLWSRHEYAQIENVDEYRALAGPVGFGFAGRFVLLGALALAGLWFAPRHGRAGGFLIGYAIVMTLAVVPFFITDRYRFHLVPAAALLAAIALERAWSVVASGAWRARAGIAGALVAGAVVVHLPAPTLGAARTARDTAFDIATRWMDRGRPELALRELEKALDLERRGVRPSGATASTATERASLYYEYGLALSQLGRAAEALPWYEKAVAFAPDNSAMVRSLADAYRAAGRTHAADSLLTRLPSLVGGGPLALASRGWSAAQAGRFDEAERLFADAAESDPGLYEAWTALARVRVQLGRIAGARDALARARAAGLDDESYYANQAFVLASAGQPDSARSALARVAPAGLSHDRSLAEVVRVTRALLAAKR